MKAVILYDRRAEEAADPDQPSFEYAHTKRGFEFPESDQALLFRLAALARECRRQFDLRGYARVDPVKIILNPLQEQKYGTE